MYLDTLHDSLLVLVRSLGPGDDLGVGPGGTDTLVGHSLGRPAHRPSEGHHPVLRERSTRIVITIVLIIIIIVPADHFLGDGVGRHLLGEAGPHPRHGGGVDDLAGLPRLPHPLQSDLRPQHHRDDVDLHTLPPPEVEVDPGVVGQYVHAGHFEELLGLVEQIDELLLLGNVAHHEADLLLSEPLPELGESVLPLGLVDVRDADLAACLQESGGEGFAETLGRAGDDGNLATDLHTEHRTVDNWRNIGSGRTEYTTDKITSISSKYMSRFSKVQSSFL